MAEDMSPYTFSIVFSLTETASAALVALFFAARFWYKLHVNSTKSGDTFKHLSAWIKLTRISAVCTFVCLFMTTFSITILMIAQLLTDHVYSQDDPWASILFTSFFVFLMLWYAASYIFMLARLVSTFQDSVYSLSNCFIYGHIAYISGFVVTAHILYALMYSGIGGIGPKWALAVNVLLYVVGLVHLGYEFNHRLFQLVLTQRQTIVAGGTRNLSDMQLKILKVIRKNTLLATVQIAAIMATCTTYVVALFLSGFRYWPFNVYSSSDAYFAVFDVIKLFVFYVSSWSVYLGFNVNENEYNKLCKHCDMRCEKCLEQWTHEKMNGHDRVLTAVSLSASPSEE